MIFLRRIPLKTADTLPTCKTMKCDRQAVMVNKKQVMLGVGFAALSAAAVLSSAATAAPAAPTVDPEQVIVVDSEATAAVADEDAAGLVPSETHKKWAIAAMVGTLLGGFAAAVGLNSLLNMLAKGGQYVGQAAAMAAKAPVKAAKIAAKAAGSALKRPGQVLLGASAIGLFLATGIAILDIQWHAGLVLGAAGTVAGAIGFKKTGATIKNWGKDRSKTDDGWDPDQPVGDIPSPTPA